jgi:actin-related protein
MTAEWIDAATWNERQPLVFDLGSYMMKAGFAGDDAPRWVGLGMP